MAICPKCKQEVARRKNGACPHCGQELQVYNGLYYRTEDGSPTIALLKCFEKFVSQQTSQKQGMAINFHISKKTAQYNRELAEAQRLLNLCDGDLDLACATLKVLFENKQFSFKMRSSLLGTQRDFVLAMAIARAVLDQEAKKDTVQQQTYNAVMQREDIWA